MKDLNDSQDPKHTLFCRKNAFVAIYALFQTKDVAFLRLGGGVAERGQCHRFLPFFIAGLPLSALPIDLVSVQISVVSYTRVKLSRVSMEQ